MGRNRSRPDRGPSVGRSRFLNFAPPALRWNYRARRPHAVGAPLGMTPASDRITLVFSFIELGQRCPPIPTKPATPTCSHIHWVV